MPDSLQSIPDSLQSMPDSQALQAAIWHTQMLSGIETQEKTPQNSLKKCQNVHSFYLARLPEESPSSIFYCDIYVN